MAKVIIYVSGGVIQDIISDCENIEVMIVDYDNEEYLHSRDRVFNTCRIDPDYFEHTLKSTEDSPLA
jgi:hypothetical protein